MNVWKNHKNDIILILAVLILAGAAALLLRLSRSGGGTVVVTIDGETVASVPLNEDSVTVFGTPGRSNTLVVENGTARVTDATCPDGICERMGPVRYEGESMICLPNRFVATVEGGASSGLDAVTG